MKEPLIDNKQRLRIAALSLLAAGLGPCAFSQESEDDDIFTLSPFEVSAEDDKGYRAQNTLAGSRLNTSLKDTGAAVSVLTSEFLQDLGATSMKDIILFSNNSVPDYGDAASNFNGNPMLGNEEWQLRIRGLPASYARNYFSWETSSDFYNVERIDQSRGPNAILFGFGSAGGIVNTTTKKASFGEVNDEVSLSVGSWNRLRGTLDLNRVLVEDKLAVRFNAMSEDSDSWREYESYQARRFHAAATFRASEKSKLQVEFETGEVKDNVARPWLIIDQAWAWRDADRPTYDNAQWDWPVSAEITQTWSEHLVYVENNGSVMNWQGMPFSYQNQRSWAHLEMTPENLEIFPVETNSGGPGAQRETDYNTYTANYELSVTPNLTLDLAYNHQDGDFLSYDPNAGNLTRYGYMGDATNVWGDASNWLPTWSANPYAGKMYIENNWTRRTQETDIDSLRASLAYSFETGEWGSHRFAAMVERSWREYYSREDGEVFVGSPFAAEAEFDSNRVFRRYYFEEGNARDIRASSWQTPLVNVTDPVSGRTLTAGWAPNQEINNSDQRQDTMLVALQSHFFERRLVTTLGLRRDSLDYESFGSTRNAQGMLALDRSALTSETFDANTVSLGAVYHFTDTVSAFVNTSNSRQLPSVNQRIVGLGLPPMPEGTGTDMGLKFDLLEGKLYATVNYYTTDYENVSEWGNINADVTSRNNRFLWAFYDADLITAAERDARIMDANAYLEDRESKGWELELIANPSENWRFVFNFSKTSVVKDNIMSEVVAWSDEATAYWLSEAGASFNFGGGDWDTLGNHIGWMTDYIDREASFNGAKARGERGFGSSLYTNYTFTEGALKGFFLGGGARYQDANVIGTYDDVLVKGEKLFLMDLSAGYGLKTEFRGKPVDIDFQLNVSNALDEDQHQVYTVAWWDPTRPERIGLQEPRKVVFTTRFSF